MPFTAATKRADSAAPPRTAACGFAPKNAKRLFTLIKREGLANVRVVVLEDFDAPVVANKSTPGSSAQTE